MDFIEVSAKNVDDAVIEACQKLVVTREKLEDEVIEEGSNGFLGIGSKPAVIKARVKATVDGKAVDKVDIGNRGVIGVDITKGEHTVEFKFNTRGLVPGLAISCVSVVALVGYTIFDKKRKQKNIPVTPEVTA